MTYAKYGTEFFDDCADQNLTVDATLTHTQAIGWIYRVERSDMRIGKHLMRRFVTSDDWGQAAKELVECGFWPDEGDAYRVVHHADVVRQSLAAQLKHRESERERQRKKRAKSADCGGCVGPNVGTNVGETQSVSQTDMQLGEAQTTGDCS